MADPERFGFRRRCGWCGVVLRIWQLNLCRMCKWASAGAISGPPTKSGSRWHAPADDFTFPRRYGYPTKTEENDK